MVKRLLKLVLSAYLVLSVAPLMSIPASAHAAHHAHKVHVKKPKKPNKPKKPTTHKRFHLL